MLRSFLLLLILTLAACAPRPKVVVPEVEPTAQLVETLLASLARNAEAAHALEGFARVRIVHPERRLGANQVLFIEKPDRLRSETLSPFGTPVLLAATDGEELSVYLPSDRSFYRGQASLENIQRFVPIPLQVADLVHIVLYDPPVIPYVDTHLRVDPQRGYVLTLRGDGGVRQEVVFDGRLRVRAANYYLDETLHMAIGYDQFDENLIPAFPLTIEMRMPQLDTRATIDLRDIELNPAIPATRFSLTPPEGVPILPIP
ncbi:LolA family protein [Geoalkalibacter halelectricus]|uniref:LolA family protein n=1 Tax=Geoalkalibacter halelectricus TaxID=2847045 RepID=UPI003D1CA345